MLSLGGFTPLSTTDWPDRLAAVAFVQGCPWRCSYCHNPELQVRGRQGGPRWSAVMATLSQCVGLLDGVVFSGGEPTLDAQLGSAVQQVRALGLQAALHTAGACPERLRTLLPQLAWVGFDLKTDFAAYDRLTARRHSGAQARSALGHLLGSGVAHEIRTTYHPALVDDAALLASARTLQAMGVQHWVLQRWRAHDQASKAQQALQAQWHWPSESVLHELRLAVPGLRLR